ncbi:MAG TPA: UDP-N-acetylmuramoyl-L-alanyl-D-glutamate--2,6-diaminopimelate ligase [Sedimenticola sp.]|nr:UDP-N-acetylmuramoyl-L-alanyl-D-glutamate--2,6-diaminopimelate ligase [Sedimenticola sp.]
MMARPRRSDGVPLTDLLAAITPLPAELDRQVTALTLDSRAVTAGGLFLALAGGSRHGLAYVDQALERGAAAILCEPGRDWTPRRIARLAAGLPVPLIQIEGLGGQVSTIAGRFYGNPSQSLEMIGITGTNGKTSCSQFLARALLPETRCGVIGTLGYGFPGALEPASHTTPDPVRLQSLLAGMRAAGAGAVAMEVSSHALHQGRVAGVRFGTVVLTNLSQDHLDYHGSMDGYAQAKARLFTQPGVSAAVLNLDDPFGRELLGRIPAGVTRIGYGIDRDAGAPPGLERWLRARDLRSDESGMRARVEGSWGEGVLESRLLGRFNVSNLLAVLAVLLQRGMPLPEALRRLAALETVPGRMERFGGGDRPLVVVDYAHTPDALEQALTALRDHVRGRLFCLFGCGGDRDRGKRPLMGAIAESLADRVLVTDDNPRTEDGDAIVWEILSGMKAPGHVGVVRDRGAAIRQVVREAGPGDLVLVAGKGHEAVQQIAGRALPFDDREQVRLALAEARK